jgi:Zn-dependent protease with chaperone function
VAAGRFDFFAQQEAARRATWKLLGLYVVAALGTVASYVAVTALVLLFPYRGLANVPPRALATVAAVVAIVVVFVSIGRAWQLREGGSAVAHMLGARYVNPFHCTPEERRLVNVVEEMSIASGIAVPPIYLLEHEAVNALVAGHSPNEAAIVVTRGALRKLSRDELQAVMGHEYSHILNGDMALNIRLVSVLAGLSYLGDQGEEMVWRAAREAQHQSREERGGGVIGAMVGALVALVGFPGVFAADAIRGAISRQRELLADQASVQFTRNPDGIAGALDSILATRSQTVLHVSHAAELAHMFFAPAVAHWWAAPTHPPIERRIRLAHPRFDRAAYRERRHGTRREVAVLDGAGNLVKNVAMGAADAVAAPTPQHVDFAAGLLAALPAELREALHSAAGAQATMLALAAGGEVPGVPRNHMLTLAELAVPAIKEQPQRARDAFIAELAAAVQADRRVTLAEFVLYTFLKQRLREGAGQAIRTQFAAIEALAAEAHLVLSLVALASGDAPAAYARGNAILRLAPEAPLRREDLDTPRVGEALERLRHLAPLRKPALLKACFECIAADGVIRLAEAELVRMVAATLDCPLPPLLASQDPAALPAARAA